MKNPFEESKWEKLNQKWYSGCFWFLVLLGGLWLAGQVFDSSSSSGVGPRFPWDTAPEEAAEVQSDLADIPDYNYDPGAGYDLSKEETQFWQDVRPPDENPDISGCSYGCTSPPSGCSIKGNIAFDTGEKIYHMPGDTYYNETVINTSYGERWFCTEQEAQVNGWRHADN